MLHAEVVAHIVDRVPDDNMDEVYTEDMVGEDMNKEVWAALVEMNKVAVVDKQEIQLMELMMVHPEKVVVFEVVAS